MFRRSLFPVLAGLATVPLLARTALAAWPDQQIRMIVPYTPAGGPDMIGRFVGERLAPKLGQPVVVENIPGASGNIGSQVVARAKPDGNTLMSQVNTLVMNPSLYKNLPYDPVTDFAPIGLTAWGSLVLVANPAQKPNNLAEFIAEAKASPRAINYGSPGVGNILHLVTEIFSQKAGIAMPEVALYEGEPNAFATGAFKNSALVAVSTGLLQNMTREEVEAVIGHEVAHVANGDMVTMTLIQGVMNTFVVFLSRVVGYAVDSFLRKVDQENSGPGIGYYVTTIVLDIVLGFLAAIIVAWFSRQREFLADAGAAHLMGRHGPGGPPASARITRRSRRLRARGPAERLVRTLCVNPPHVGVIPPESVIFGL